MALQVDKWVAAGIEAVKWSKLTNPADAAEMSMWCSYFDFHVAALWIDNNPQSYQLALSEGFEPLSPLDQADVDHVRLHIAMTLAAQADELLANVDSVTADRIRVIVNDQLQVERVSTRSVGTALQWSSQAAG